MDDFVAFSAGFQPLVAACGYNGEIQWQPLMRSDLFLIEDPDEVPGAWLFVKDLQGIVNGFGTDKSSQSYKRVYAVVRGLFMFFFFNPQEDPTFMIPLLDMDVVIPDRDAKIFDDRMLFKANEGFEFDIQYKGTRLLRVSSQTDKERKEWQLIVNSRKSSRNKKAVEEEVIMSLLLGINNGQANNTGYTITTTRLLGQSRFVAPVVSTAGGGLDESVASSNNNNNNTSNNNINHRPFSDNNHHHMQSSSNSNHGQDDYEGDLQALASSRLSNSNTSVHSDITNDDPDGLLMREARQRQNDHRELTTMHETKVKAQELEQQNPMNLSTLFRMMLFFFDEPLVEDPVGNSVVKSSINNKIVSTPHVKGQICEHMLTTVYQFYCGDNGFMSFEQFMEFMDDSGIWKTHAPRDDNDEPLLSFQEKLDPANLWSLVPKEYGYAKTYTSRGNIQIDDDDQFSMNFAQFYQILIIITSIVYADLAERDLTLALNKLLQEAICPLYGWCVKSNYKTGSVDVLIREERIPLLLITYAPNLWRVFLLYATDVVSKPAELTLAFPEYAQVNEKGMFGLTPGFPFHSKLKSESLYVSEAAVIRFCTDYALCPHILTKAELRKVFSEVNRPKHLVTSKFSTRDQAPTNSSLLKTTTTQQKLAQKAAGPLRHRLGSPTKSTPPPPPPISSAASMAKSISPDERPRGLAFSEFVEFICRIAIDGMEKDNYHSLFPTPFSKVLSILTIWGIADMKKLEEVRILHNSEKIVVSA